MNTLQEVKNSCTIGVKTCARCKKQYKKTGKGSTKSKYCVVCKPVVKKEQMQQSETRRQERLNGYIPSDDELFYYGYKEPLRRVENGYGYMGVVSYNKEKDKVQCHICGRLYRNVASHSKFAHEKSASEYKNLFGLSQNTALVGEGTRSKLITAHKMIPSFSQQGKTKEQIRAHMKVMSDRSSRKNNGKWSLERRNQFGLCPDQLLDKIVKLQEKLKRRPTAKEYVSEYGSFQSVITVYGSWEVAVEKAGLRTYTQEKSEKSNPEWLLEQLRFFYQKYGRTARTSDSRRGLIPGHQVYHSVFGTFNNARILAGVPVVIPVSKYRYDEVLIDSPEKIAEIKHNLLLKQRN